MGGRGAAESIAGEGGAIPIGGGIGIGGAGITGSATLPLLRLILSSFCLLIPSTSITGVGNSSISSIGSIDTLGITGGAASGFRP